MMMNDAQRGHVHFVYHSFFLSTTDNSCIRSTQVSNLAKVHDANTSRMNDAPAGYLASYSSVEQDSLGAENCKQPPNDQ
jgi:hypothetical protein